MSPSLALQSAANLPSSARRSRIYILRLYHPSEGEDTRVRPYDISLYCSTESAFLIYELCSQTSVACTLAALDPPQGLETTRILEINSAILSPDALWLEGWPRLDGVILCYDATNPESFRRIPELVGG